MAVFAIISGPIKSGKTTRLMRWASSQKNIDGILQPVIEDKRFIYHIGSRTLKQLEAENFSDSKETIDIGKYKFNIETFKWAKENLRNGFNQHPNCLVVDEIGPLELDGKGLEPIISEIILKQNKFTGRIIFVVRESLLEKFTRHYNLEGKFEMMSLG